MANRWYNQFRLQLEKEVVSLFGKVTFGAAGAPTLVTAKSKGIYSIAHGATGVYTITLQDAYVSLLNLSWVFLFASAPQSLGGYVVSTTVGSSGTSKPEIVVTFVDDAGSAVDPADGEALLFQVNLSNSTAP